MIVPLEYEYANTSQSVPQFFETQSCFRISDYRAFDPNAAQHVIIQQRVVSENGFCSSLKTLEVFSCGEGSLHFDSPSIRKFRAALLEILSEVSNAEIVPLDCTT